MRIGALCGAWALLFLCWAGAAEALSLHPVFADHAVLQRDQPIRVYGEAAPGAEVRVTLAQASATARADDAGRWTATLPAMGAGGPHTLSASADGATARAQDVLIGDVFVCSGQSNMEMSVAGAQGAFFEIGRSANNAIRMLSIAHQTATAPLARFAGDVAWQVAGPETVGSWSAACYFYAREIQPTANAPIGLIHASWGGSNIRAWLSEAAFEQLGGYEQQLAMLRVFREDEAAAQQAFGAEWGKWWRGVSGDAPGAEPWNTRNLRGWRIAPEGLGNWQDWGPEFARFTGSMFYRTSVRLTAAQARAGATLYLGGVDEVDQTWINGAVIGNTFGWGSGRVYRIPPGVLRAGENTITVNVINTWSAGGLVGEPAARRIAFANGQSVPLDGRWRYLRTPDAYGYPPRSPWESIAGLSGMYNGMIAPIGAYNVRGALWYQGESNAGEGETYRGLMAALMADWRAQFQNPGLAFLIAQLPNFGARPTAPGPSGWAEVREAQRQAVLADAHAGLAVLIDAGDPNDLHPANKQEVGRRLARAGRHVVYGEALAPSGPALAGVSRAGGEVVVAFRDIEGGLVAYGADGPIGFELCGAAQDSCRYALARIDGANVRLQVPADAAPTRVRFCWADSPLCTLYDRGGLPAGPFEAPIQ